MENAKIRARASDVKSNFFFLASHFAISDSNKNFAESETNLFRPVNDAIFPYLVNIIFISMLFRFQSYTTGIAPISFRRLAYKFCSKFETHHLRNCIT